MAIVPSSAHSFSGHLGSLRTDCFGDVKEQSNPSIPSRLIHLVELCRTTHDAGNDRATPTQSMRRRCVRINGWDDGPLICLHFLHLDSDAKETIMQAVIGYGNLVQRQHTVLGKA